MYPGNAFKEIKQFGNHGRAAGGVCGVEMALMDLAGKAYGVPAYQMLGGNIAIISGFTEIRQRLMIR